MGLFILPKCIWRVRKPYPTLLGALAAEQTKDFVRITEKIKYPKAGVALIYLLVKEKNG